MSVKTTMFLDQPAKIEINSYTSTIDGEEFTTLTVSRKDFCEIQFHSITRENLTLLRDKIDEFLKEVSE